MKQIRQGLFETNSSSEHSLSIMKEADYEAWKNDEIAVMFNFDEDSDSDGGDSDGFLSTWGEFQCTFFKDKYMPDPEETRRKHEDSEGLGKRRGRRRVDIKDLSKFQGPSR